MHSKIYIFGSMKKETFDSALRSTWNLVSRMYNKEASKFDSTMATGFALLSIDAGGTPSTTLGPKMGMESTSLSRLLNTMEERNLIYRSQNPDDGRSILVHLTSFGKEKRDDSKGVVLHFNKIIEESLSPEKINIFFEVMNKIKEKTQNFEYFTPILKTK